MAICLWFSPAVISNSLMSDKRQWISSARLTSRFALGIFSFSLLCLLSLSYYFQWLVKVDHQLYDQQIRWLDSDPPEDIVVVAIDEQSLSEIGQWPWSRRYHGELIGLLEEGGARLVAYDIVFSEQSLLDLSGDAALQKALQLDLAVILPIYVDQLQKGAQLVEVMPHPMFAEFSELGHVNTELDSDGVVRSAYLYQGVGDAYWKHFSLTAAEILGYVKPRLKSKGVSPNIRSAPFYRVAEQQVYIPFAGDTGTFQQVSFVDVIKGRVPTSVFNDKVVFVGATALTLGDALQTPTTVHGEQMPGVEINANIFDAIRKQHLIHPIDPLLGMFFSITLLLIILIVVPRVSAPVALLVTGFVCGLGLLGAYWVLVKYYIWIPSASAIFWAFLVYPLWSVIRLDQALRYFKKQFVILTEQLEESSDSGLIPEPGKKSFFRVDTLFASLGIPDCGIWKDGERYYLRGSTTKGGRDFWLNNLDYRRYSVAFKESTYDIVLPLLKLTAVDDSVNRFLVDLITLTETPEDMEDKPSYDLLINSLEKVRQSQIRLSQARSLFQSCLIEMAEGVIITDMFAEILFSNKMANRLLSLDDEQSLWQTFSEMEIVSGSDCWETVFRFVLLNNNHKQQIEIRTSSGKEILLNLEVVGEMDAIHRFVVINVVDITRIKNAQRTRNETINFVSHDMRTPMVSLMSYAERLSSQHGGDNEWQDALANIRHYANKSLHFSEQFLQLAKVDNDEPIQHYDVDMLDVACNAKDDIYNQAVQKNIRITMAEDGDDFWVRSNGDLLERLLVNLLSNAVKYSGSGASVIIALQASAKGVLVSVVDTGPGIPEDEQKYIFKSFHRSYRHQGGKTGAGLGLRFVQVALNRLDSTLEFTTSSDGTCFEFMLKRELNT